MEPWAASSHAAIKAARAEGRDMKTQHEAHVDRPLVEEGQGLRCTPLLASRRVCTRSLWYLLGIKEAILK